MNKYIINKIPFPEGTIVELSTLSDRVNGYLKIQDNLHMIFTTKKNKGSIYNDKENIYINGAVIKDYMMKFNKDTTSLEASNLIQLYYSIKSMYEGQEDE